MLSRGDGTKEVVGYVVDYIGRVDAYAGGMTLAVTGGSCDCQSHRVKARHSLLLTEHPGACNTISEEPRLTRCKNTFSSKSF